VRAGIFVFSSRIIGSVPVIIDSAGKNKIEVHPIRIIF